MLCPSHARSGSPVLLPEAHSATTACILALSGALSSKFAK